MRKSFLLLVLQLIFFTFHVNAQYEVRVSTDYPPYNFSNDQGEIVGFNIDILNAIKELYNIKIEVTGSDWRKANTDLENGNISAIAGAHYPGSPDNNYIYTRSVIQTSHSFLYNQKNLNRISLEQIRTTKQPLIALWNNDVLIHYVLSINPNSQFVFVSNYTELIDALEREDVTCAFSQKISSIYYAKKLGKPYIHAANEEILERNMGFKISTESPQLAEILNNGLEIIMSNGEYQKIYDKWIKDYNTQNYNWQHFFRYFIFAGVLISAIIILLLFFNQILKNRVRGRTEDLQNQLEVNIQIKNELEKQKLKAEESDKMKSAFLANMSHEIRTPMNGILGFTDLLKSYDYSKDEQTHFINLIQQSGDRMLTTINNIIEISKIESGVETLQFDETNIEKIINELVQFFIPEAKRKGIELIINKNGVSTETIFYTDSYKLNSILTNLIKNALKFTLKGSIKIGYSISNEIANFYVSDSGIGIKPEKQKAIFDYFIQADNSYSSRFEGSGLGLSISSQYTKMLQGEIWVESEFNVGSTFYVNIPNHKQTTEKEIIQTKNIPNRNEVIPGDLKIIIAEDDKTSFFFLKYILEKITPNILHADNGLKAVELIRNNPDTDIILMDSKMPELNGLEAVKQIREFNKKVFIISQTAYAQNGYKVKTLEAGCNAYIEKPINKDKLFDIIAKSRITN